MAFDRKKLASELLKLADVIEKEAFGKTYFMCDECNHTSNLANINKIRNKVASENGVKSISPISVEDKIACPVIECSGKMAYVATSESDKYYIEVEAGKEEDPFAPLNEGDTPEDAPEEVTPEEGNAPDEDGTDEAPSGKNDESDESNFEPVDEQKPELKNAPEDEGPNAEGPLEELIEEEIEEERDNKPKKKRKKKDKADDEKAVPKFTEMPEDMKDVKMKTASEDRYYQSVARYSNM